MYLKTLTLRGFKSFASATRFEFEPGITCVVGPNGSGKSNVVDALSWVMGEQGAKTLRGGKMEDVIFAGTLGRAPLGRAEVSLTIDNSDGALPIDYQEVTITRTLFRNGGSEYAINGAACRLLDIQDLLSDSGLGREMHVIVGQGQLDAVLRATPTERRGFIEEAAGVLKHRKRKEKALRKLDSMQGNLLRLTDLIAELHRQLGPLGRQAQAARKASVIAAIVRDSGARLLADELNLSVLSRDENAQKVAQLRHECAQLDENLHAARQQLTILENTTHELSPQLRSAQELVNTLIAQREQLRSIASVAEERSRNLGVDATPDTAQLASDLPRQIERTQQQHLEAQHELAAAQNNLTRKEEIRSQAAQQAALVTNRRDRAEQKAAQYRARLSELDTAIARESSRIEALDNAHAHVTGEIQASIRKRDEHIRLAEAESTRQLSSAQSSTDDADPPAQSAHDIEQHIVSLQHELDSFTAELEALTAEHLEVEKQRVSVQARVEHLLVEQERQRGTAAKLVEHDERLTYFAEHIEVEQRYAPAIAALLAQYDHCVIAPNHTVGQQSLDWARNHEHTNFVLAYPARSTATHAERTELLRDSLPHKCVLACDVVRFTTSNTALQQLLSRVVVCAEDTGFTLVEQHDDITVVTPTGTLITRESVHTYEERTSPLEQVHVLHEEHERLDALHERTHEVHERITRARTAVENLNHRIKNKRSELRRTQEQEKENLAQTAHTHARIAAYSDEIERAEKRLADTVRQRAAVQDKHDQLNAQRLDLINTQETTTDEVPSAEEIMRCTQEVERAREAETLSRLDVRSLQERVKALENRKHGLQRALKTEEDAHQAAVLAAEKRRAQAQHAQRVCVKARHALQLIERSVEEASEHKSIKETQRDTYENELASLRADVTQHDSVLRQKLEHLHRQDLQYSTLTTSTEQLERRAVDEYGLSSKELIEQFGPHMMVPVYTFPRGRSLGKDAPEEVEQGSGLTGETPFVREVVEKAHEKAQKALAGLGRVNPLALEEYTALEERHKFLTDQLADLKKSRSDLLGLINDIERRVQEAFASAFEDTAQQFAEVFPRLFPGGEGRMFLTDPDDLLLTGIEIEARPAGKKVKRLSLLSGGERSLTAVAMLVSIFKARPSPFYVMDEVEAALDDTNLGRLLEVFKELQDDSQLIVITHQKRTMEIADALYGVTMQGNGVSSVMSQRMHVDSSA
ncbi:chromosome segregation protein SMC [Timonella sp. A28]|uniref:chromosome segregation protein SMC n=1 Tax=Timonella sp. A28 TaxID=3442640 RepID=UPI003EB85A78